MQTNTQTSTAAELTEQKAAERRRRQLDRAARLLSSVGSNGGDGDETQ